MRAAAAIDGRDLQVEGHCSVHKSHGPARLFASIDQHHNLGVGGRQFGRFAEDDEIRADL